MAKACIDVSIIVRLTVNNYILNIFYISKQTLG
jgi:hypothetical protein